MSYSRQIRPNSSWSWSSVGIDFWSQNMFIGCLPYTGCEGPHRKSSRTIPKTQAAVPGFCWLHSTSGTNGCRLQRCAAGDLNQFDSGKCVWGPWGWVPFFLWWIFSSFWPWWCWVLETVDLRYGFDFVEIFSSYGYDVLWLLISYAVKSQCPSHTKRKHLVVFIL